MKYIFNSRCTDDRECSMFAFLGQAYFVQHGLQLQQFLNTFQHFPLGRVSMRNTGVRFIQGRSFSLGTRVAGG